MVFHWSLSDSKSPQVSRTLHSFLAVLNSAVVWRVSTRPPTSTSSSPFSNPLVTVPNAPITIGIIVTSIIIIIISLLACFPLWLYLVVSHLNISESKSSQVSTPFLKVFSPITKCSGFDSLDSSSINNSASLFS